MPSQKFILLIITCAVLAAAGNCAWWSPNWVLSHSSPGSIKRLGHNVSSYWENFPERPYSSFADVSINVIISAGTAGTTSQAKAGTSLISNFAPSAATINAMGPLKSLFWLPNNALILHTETKNLATYFAGAWKTDINTDINIGYEAVLPLYDEGGLRILSGNSSGFINIQSLESLPAKTPIPMNNVSASPILQIFSLSKEFYFINAANVLVYLPLNGSAASPKFQLTGSSSNVTKPLAYKKKGGDDFLFVLYQDKKLSLIQFSPSTNEIPLNTNVCDMILGSGASFQDLLIVVLCDGDVKTLELDSYLSATMTTPPAENWTRIIKSTGKSSNSSNIVEIAFNFVQANENTAIQRGQPVVVVAKNNQMIFMYNFVTKRITNLQSYWAPINTTQTSNMLFMPQNLLTLEDFTNPNRAGISNLVIGLSTGLIRQLKNLPFMLRSMSETDGPLYTRRVFNSNQSSNYEFYGHYQKKDGLSWAAVLRSLIKFYQPEVRTPKLCEVLNFYAIRGENCCELYQADYYLQDSFENLHPACRAQVSDNSNNFLSILAHYNISAISSTELPSFQRVQAEITNNNIIVIRSQNLNNSPPTDQFIAIFGFQKSSIANRGDKDTLIVWDARENAGLRPVPYASLKDYMSPLLPSNIYYIRA